MTGMREHDARAYADASTEHDAPAYATDGRTDGLTQKHSPNAESSPSVSRAGGQNDSTPSQPVSDLSVPAPQRDPSAEDGWVRFYFDDADPVAECACGWHTHGDSASDAFGAWWKHRREHDDAAGEQRPVVPTPRPLDLDALSAQIELDRKDGYPTMLAEQLVGELRAARAEADELRQAYRTVCDYAEQHDATRAELNEAVAEAARVREALQAIRDRARSEIADAKEGEHYHAEVNNGAGLATEQSRRRAWEAVVRALDAALDGSE